MDEKIVFLRGMPNGDSLFTLWILLLVLAGKTNNGGLIYFKPGIPYTSQMLSMISNIPVSSVELALRTMKDFEMIEIDDNGLIILNWEKHQNIKGLEHIKEQTRKRVQRHRERQKALASNVTRNVTCNANTPDVTPCNALDIDKDLDLEKDTNNINTAPAIEEIILLWKQMEISKIPINQERTEEAIFKAIKDYGKEAVVQAVKNYVAILSDKNSLLDTHWQCYVFMEVHIEKFLDLESAKKMYKGGGNGANRKHYSRNGSKTGSSSERPDASHYTGGKYGGFFAADEPDEDS
jgi:predicted phage replisome organizer